MQLKNEIYSLFKEKVPAILPILKTGLVLDKDCELTQLRSLMRSKDFNQVNCLWMELNDSFPADIFWNVKACLVFKKVVLGIAVLDSHQYSQHIDKSIVKEMKIRIWENVNSCLKIYKQHLNNKNGNNNQISSETMNENDFNNIKDNENQTDFVKGLKSEFNVEQFISQMEEQFLRFEQEILNVELINVKTDSDIESAQLQAYLKQLDSICRDDVLNEAIKRDRREVLDLFTK